jgi:Histidine kinase-, DNA gyrase B-, and HSP90-like ATPase
MHDLSLYLLEMLENAVRAGAAHVVTTMAADRDADRLTVVVEDDGPGLPVPPAEVLDPYFTTKPGKKTGLGLSLFLQDAEAAGGGLSVGRSQTAGGVEVRAWMGLTHVDRPPAGDLATSLAVMAATNPEVEFTVVVVDGDGQATLRGAELTLDAAPLVAFQQVLDQPFSESTPPARRSQMNRAKESR